MTQGMSRRHLFDKGPPVTRATLIAGSHVLLAISHTQMRHSRFRLACSLLQIADTSQRVMSSLAHHLVSHGQEPLSNRTKVEAGVSRQPDQQPAREEPHQP